VNKIVHYV